MIQATHDQTMNVLQWAPAPTASRTPNDFAELFGSAAMAAPASSPSSTGVTPALTNPDVQQWLNSYYAELGAPAAAGVSFQAAPGAGTNYPAGSIYGPDAIYGQALANQDGNAFAQATGMSATNLTSQLPGIPAQSAQDEWDRRLALFNAERLQSGQPIDTSAYWSNPGSVTLGGVAYTPQQLGYAGPGQSSGPEPIYISIANEVAPGAYSVPGYQGTVKGIQPGQFYTLQQLEKAGLPAGQADTEYYPGSWNETTTA
jgi:hypothetical protein